MPVRSSARRSAIARPAAVLSTPSVNADGPLCCDARSRSQHGSRERSCFGGSSSGRTTDSDSVYLGSNPSPPANNKGPPQGGPFALGRVASTHNSTYVAISTDSGGLVSQPMIRALSVSLVQHAASVMGPERAEWGAAMVNELRQLDSDRQSLVWALGCVWSAYVERYSGRALSV